MIYKNLGHSPLKVSRICLGTMMFADQTSMAEARSIVDHAQQNGCNFIDTADVYSIGKSEVMTGELIKAKRNQWILASKVGNSMSDNVNEREYSRTWMLRASAIFVWSANIMVPKQMRETFKGLRPKFL